MIVPDTDKKLLSWRSALMYHVDLLLQIPINLASPFILSPSEIEAIVEAVNEVNDCNLSSVCHEGVGKLASTSAGEVEGNEINLNLFRIFGTKFATTNGFDVEKTAEYTQLKSNKSAMVASAAMSVAYFEQWENLFGNTIMSFLNGTLKGKKRSAQSLVFEIGFLLYFFPLYLTLVIIYTIFQAVTISVAPSIFYKVIYIFTNIVKMSSVLPIGLISVIIRSVVDVAPPLEALPQYVEIPSEDVGTITYEFIKPRQDMKVGLRFGCDRKGDLTISNIKANSIVSNTGLRIGDMVCTINGSEVKNMPPKQAAEILLEASGVIELEVSHSKNVIEFDENTV